MGVFLLFFLFLLFSVQKYSIYSFGVLIRSLLKIYRKGSSNRIAVASLAEEWRQDISVNK